MALIVSLLLIVAALVALAYSSAGALGWSVVGTALIAVTTVSGLLPLWGGIVVWGVLVAR